VTDEKPLADISDRRIIQYFACGFSLVVVSDIPNNWGIWFFVARGILVFLLVATYLMPTRQSVLLLFMLAIAGQDIVSSGDLADASIEYATASIWQMHLGPINPSWIIFGSIFWQLFRIREMIVPTFVNRAILWFITVPVITGLIYGGLFSEHAVVEVVQDLKFFIMLIASFVLFYSLFKKDPRFLTIAIAAFTGVLLARHMADLIYLVANVGPAIATGVSRASEDSAKGGVAFLVFFGLSLILIQRRLLLGIAVTIPSVLLLVAYGTRNLWITFLLGAVVSILLLGLRRSVLFISIAAVLSIGGIWALVMVNPESAAVVLARSKSITEGRGPEQFAVLVDYNLISRIDQVRYAEIVNVFDSVGRRYAYLWGTGYGGYYEDTIAYFPFDLKSSFPEHSLDTGKYYMTHSFSTQMFLKHGLIGMFFIYALWIIPGYALFKIFRNRNMFAADKPIMFNSAMFCIAAFLPTAMLQTFWSGKGLFINGMIIASCAEFARHYTGTRVCLRTGPNLLT